MNQRCRYHCKIDDNDGKPEFSIRVIEEGFTEVVEFKGNTPKGVCVCPFNRLSVSLSVHTKVVCTSFCEKSDLFSIHYKKSVEKSHKVVHLCVFEDKAIHAFNSYPI